MTIPRPTWLALIEAALSRVPIVWLSGVRRVGKTTLARQLPQAQLLNCDLPSVADLARDPEHMLATITSPLVVLDEIHQLDDPARLLKIAADEHPRLRVVATGSSTLAATQKFRDSLTGRKRTVTLRPVLCSELEAFGVPSLDRRLLHGGLPEPLCAERPPADFYAEWLDSYFARDVQELYRLEKRAAFLRFVTLVLQQSGGMFEGTSFAKHTGVSRPTVGVWLDVLETTHVARAVRPFHAGSRREILAQPKLYAFDTGFVAWARGFSDLRPDDRGPLLEHLVLDELDAAGHTDRVRFWRDKSQREIDFVLDRGRAGADAVECKWRPEAFEPRSLLAFRELVPAGRNLVVCGTLSRPSTRRVAGHEIRFVPIAGLGRELMTEGR